MTLHLFHAKERRRLHQQTRLSSYALIAPPHGNRRQAQQYAQLWQHIRPPQQSCAPSAETPDATAAPTVCTFSP